MEISGILMWKIVLLKLLFPGNYFCEHDEDTDYCA